jgi:putative transposase
MVTAVRLNRAQAALLANRITVVMITLAVSPSTVHLIRNTFRLASKRDWDALKRDVKPIYTAVNAEAARAALDDLAERWGQRYPAIIRLWHNAWEEFIPFLDYDVEIRQVICTTNAIESLNARYRRAVKARGHFPTEQAGWIQPVNATPAGKGPVGHAVEASPERFAITFGDRSPAAETYY